LKQRRVQPDGYAVLFWQTTSVLDLELPAVDAAPLAPQLLSCESNPFASERTTLIVVSVDGQ
jgi:hypothetical protein